MHQWLNISQTCLQIYQKSFHIRFISNEWKYERAGKEFDGREIESESVRQYQREEIEYVWVGFSTTERHWNLGKAFTRDEIEREETCSKNTRTK